MQTTIKADKLAALLAGASVAACTDKSVMILNVVQLELGDNKIRLSATDRYRLALGELPIDYAGDPIKLIISLDSVKQLVAWLKPLKDSHVILDTTDLGLTITSDTQNYLLTKLDQDYPDLAKVFPTEFDGVSEILFDSTYISDVVKVSGKGIRVKWQFSTPVRPAIATFSDKHGINWQYLVMPMRAAA